MSKYRLSTYILYIQNILFGVISKYKKYDWDYIFLLGVFIVLLCGRLMCCFQGDIAWKDVHKIYNGGISVFGSFYGGLFYSLFISYIYSLNPIFIC